MNNVKRVLWILVPIIMVAVLGSVFVNLGTDWFGVLNRPSQWIPDFIIPVVWTIIYITFAVVLLRWSANQSINKSTLVLLIINGILNVFWCLIFFTLKQAFGGNILIILNLIFGIALWINVFKRQKAYACFLAIYPIWLSVAASLNLALWILN